uniref:Cyclin-dependent kinase inhibitor domain-containing protein n=1 Tax=Acrobeloides nanus TaxID=290746 RepID=A0A914D143_9BILA
MPPKPSVRRNLFGTSDKEKTSAWLSAQEKGYMDEKMSKWGFDFHAGHPLNEPSPSSELEYEAIDLKEVPKFYHPKNIYNEIRSKPVLRKRKILSEEDGLQKSSATGSLSQEHITLERPTDISFVSPIKMRRRPKPLQGEIPPEDLIQKKLSGDYVQVYKKKATAGIGVVETKGFGAGDTTRTKRVASGSQTSIDHIPSTSSGIDSDLGEMSHHSEEKLELTPVQPMMTRIRRSALHR